MKLYMKILIVLICAGFTISMENSTYPPRMPEAKQIIYKKTKEAELILYVFNPDGHKPEDKRSAIVFIHGGGWNHGSPQVFHDRCRYFAERGMVAFNVMYRVKRRHKTGIGECIKDVKSAIRYVRKNGKTLGIDPKKVAVSGSSAGGHLTVAAAVLTKINEKGEDTKISSVPDAMILYYPALMIAQGDEQFDEQTMKFLKNWPKSCQKISPYHNIKENMPPCIMFHGTEDKTIPYGTAKAFEKKMKEKKNECELVTYEGMGHGWKKKDKPKLWVDSTKKAEEFLIKHKFLKEKGDPQAFYDKHIKK